MARMIVQKIVFKNTPIATLYNTYMDARELGWGDYYWKPWKKYFSGKRQKK